MENLPGSGREFTKIPTTQNEEKNKLVIFHNFVEGFCHELHGKLESISEMILTMPQDTLLKYVKIIKTLHEVICFLLFSK